MGWGGWTGGGSGGSAAKQPPYTSGAVVCEYANIVREVAPAREASAEAGGRRELAELRLCDARTHGCFRPSVRSPACLESNVNTGLIIIIIIFHALAASSAG